MQMHVYPEGDTSDTEMQGILVSLVQRRCKVSNLPEIQSHNWMVINIIV